MKKQILSLSMCSAIVLMSSASAQASTVNFYTTGTFGPGCTSIVTLVSSITCNAVGGSLTFNYHNSLAAPDTKILTDANPVAVQYGSFVTNGTANFGGITLTLNVFQTNPSVGSQGLVGPLTGAFAPGSGGLVWGPVNPTSWSIGAIDWTLTTESTIGGIRIDPPTAAGAPGPLSLIEGTVREPALAAVPEPSTFGLFVAGLSALTLAVRRRRDATRA